MYVINLYRIQLQSCLCCKVRNDNGGGCDDDPVNGRDSYDPVDGGDSDDPVDGGDSDNFVDDGDFLCI